MHARARDDGVAADSAIQRGIHDEPEGSRAHPSTTGRSRGHAAGKKPVRLPSSAVFGRDGRVLARAVPREGVVDRRPAEASTRRYPRAGVPVGYVDPFLGVAEDDWESTR